MKRFFTIAGSVLLLAIIVRWAAKDRPPTGVPAGTSALTERPRGAATTQVAASEGTSALTARPHGASSTPLEAQTQLKTLREILQSRNDNDPRLDSDFNDLSPEAKDLFRQEYRGIPPERRNERGTIVYLLGKNLKFHEDWAFLRAVAAEPPCLSLADCSREQAPGGEGEAFGDEVTLAYPSLVALRQTQRALEEGGKDPSVKKEAMGVISAAKGSKAPIVVKSAEKLERRFRPRN